MDREKVINALENCVRNGVCINCEYEEHIACKTCLMADALALLKEQEAVKPILKREGRNKYDNDYCCPICDNDVVYEQNFCSECGRPFVWEGW